MRFSLSLLLILGLFGVFAEAQFGGFFRNVFRGPPRRPQQRPPPRQNNNNNNFRAAPSRGGGCSNGPAPNANLQTFQGRRYFASWEYGCTSLAGGNAAQNYCRRFGMNAVSLDNSGKSQFYTNLVARANQRYFWTGGTKSGNGINWPSGSFQGFNQVGPWSNTGGAGRPQPDNREGDEFCIAVLNNFYNDGVTLHDVSCHHTKPTICEG